MCGNGGPPGSEGCQWVGDNACSLLVLQLVDVPCRAYLVWSADAGLFDYSVMVDELQNEWPGSPEVRVPGVGSDAERVQGAKVVSTTDRENGICDTGESFLEWLNEVVDR